MIVLAAVVLAGCVALIVLDPSEAGPWLTGLGMLAAIGLWISAFVRPKDQ